MKRKYWLIAGEVILIAALVWIDRIVKTWAEVSLQGQPPVVLVRGVFQLTYARNIGAAFSILENAKWFFIITAVVIILALVFVILRIIFHPSFSFKEKETTAVLFLAPMIIAGALGNVIDRVAYGYVIDMFDFVLIHFPIFNVADSYICIAVAILAILLIARKNFLDRIEEMVRKGKRTE